MKISQKSYLEKVLGRFGMKEAKPVLTPIAQHFKLSEKHCQTTEEEVQSMSKIPYASVIGCLMYSMICTRPDLAYATSLISRFMSNPGKEHWSVVKRVFKYVRRTSSFGLLYKKIEGCVDKLMGYCDSDYCGDLDKRRSLAGYHFTLFGNVISWKASL